MTTVFPEATPHSPSIPHMSLNPNNIAFQHLSIVDIGDDFKWPGAVAVEEKKGHIFVADMGSNGGRIRIFSEEGEIINQFDFHNMSSIWGILLHQERLYTSVTMHHSVSMFKLPGLILKKQVGKFGFGKEDFRYPRQLALSPDHLVYVADELNSRIQILNSDLVFQRSLQHHTMAHPVDVKFSTNQMFVLSRLGDFCVHIFTLSGEKLRAIIDIGSDAMQVRGAFFFCLDADNNIAISDYSAHAIKIFSPEGELIQTLGNVGDEPGEFYNPHGIALLRKTKLISVSQKMTNALQIFSI